MAKQRPASGSDGEGSGHSAQKGKSRPPAKRKKKSNAVIYVLIIMILLLLAVTVVGLIYIIQPPDVDSKITEIDEIVLADDTAKGLEELKTLRDENIEVLSQAQDENIKKRVEGLEEWQNLWTQWKSEGESVDPQETIGAIRGLASKLPEYDGLFKRKIGEIESGTEKRILAQIESARGLVLGAYEQATVVFKGLTDKYPDNPAVRKGIEALLIQGLDSIESEVKKRAQAVEYDAALAQVENATKLTSAFSAYFTQPQQVEARAKTLQDQVQHDKELIAAALKVKEMPAGPERDELAAAVAPEALAFEGEGPRKLIQDVVALLPGGVVPTESVEASPTEEPTLPPEVVTAGEPTATPEAAATEAPTGAATREVTLRIRVTADDKPLIGATVSIDGVEAGITRNEGDLNWPVQASSGQKSVVSIKLEGYSFEQESQEVEIGAGEDYEVRFAGKPLVTPTETPLPATETPTETPVPPTATEAPPTETPVPPTETPVPPTEAPAVPTEAPAVPTEAPAVPTDTAVPAPTKAQAVPTNTPVPPTKTPVPPTKTPVPPTKTPVPPTNTPIPPTKVPPTKTPVPPTRTPVPPTNTPIPPTKVPTKTPVPPTNTPIPPTKVPPTPTKVPPTPTKASAPPVVPTAVPPKAGATATATTKPAAPPTPTKRAAEPPVVGCEKAVQYLDKAKQFHEKKQFDLALEMAQQVTRDPKCEFTFVQAMGLVSRIQVFELKRFENGIQSAKKGLEVDSRQTTLWFTAGYAQYQVDSYGEAISSFQEVIRHRVAVPVPEETLIQTRYLIADAADRRALRDKVQGKSAKNQELLQDAINYWQEFQDFCMDATCQEEKLGRADTRIKELRQLLSLEQLQKN